MPKNKKSKSCYTKKNAKKENSKLVCWDNFTKTQKKEIAGKFDSEVLELIFDHIQENNLNPGVAQFVLIQRAEAVGERSAGHRAGFKTVVQMTRKRLQRAIETMDRDALPGPYEDRGFKAERLEP